MSGSTNNKEFLVENFSISIMGLEHFSPRGGSIRGDFCLEVALEDIMLPENKKIIQMYFESISNEFCDNFQYHINKVILIEPNKVKAFQFPIQYYTAVCSKNVGKL